MSFPYFIRAGRWVINPRRVISIEDRSTPARSVDGGQIIMMLDSGFSVELIGGDAKAMRKMLDRLVPQDPDGESEVDPVPPGTGAKSGKGSRSGPRLSVDNIGDPKGGGAAGGGGGVRE